MTLSQLQTAAKALVAGATTAAGTFVSLQAKGGTPVWLEVVSALGAAIVAGAATYRVPNKGTSQLDANPPG